MTSPQQHIDDLAAYVVASPTSYHAAAEGARRLAAAGFAERDESAEWSVEPGGHFVVRDGALVAWRVPGSAGPTTPYRIIGSHTDSPGFKLKPRPDIGAAGYQQVGIEVYGGPLLNSWLDRELGLAGRLVLSDGRLVLVRTGALMRIPQLAVHLDRGVNEDGVKLDKQTHTAPIWSVGRRDRRLIDQLAESAGCEPGDIDGYDVFAYAVQPPAVFGPDDEFFACARLDNLSSVHASLTALIDAPDADTIQLLVANDHEELGSESRSGASGPFLEDVIMRTSYGLGADAEQSRRALARSICLSADAGHAVHPNYVTRHDPANQPVLNGGPLLKINANQRYATDAPGAAIWRRACRAAGVTTQEFVSNNSQPCGSTIGPLTATRLGITTIDVGIPLLSMHSARELAGTQDAPALAEAMKAFLAESV